MKLLAEKRMQYSSMNAEIVTDILDTNSDTDHDSDLIQKLKEQLSNSLQVAAAAEEDVKSSSRTDPVELPRSSEVKYVRLNDITQDEEYLNTSAALKASPRVPKSNSSVLTARASLFARRLSSGHQRLSQQTRRHNIQRLMYDPRRKF